MTGRNQEAQLNTLFRAMQQASRSIYGNAKIAFKRNGEQVTEVHVWLDQSKSIYFDMVISETVFTFTEMGFEGVYFPEVRPVRVGRTDIAFGVFSLSSETLGAPSVYFTITLDRPRRRYSNQCTRNAIAR